MNKPMSFRRKCDILNVVCDKAKVNPLKSALENGQTIIVNGSKPEGQALISRLKDYGVNYLEEKDIFYYG